MRILQIAPRIPFPEDDGGKIGIANIAREFKNLGADLTFLYYYDDEKDLCYPEYANDIAEMIPVAHSTSNSIGRIAKSLLLNRSIYIDKHFSKELEIYFKSFAQDKKFDVIHVDHTAMAQAGLFLKKLLNIPIGLRLHNVEWTIWQRYYNNLSSLSPKRLYIKKQAELLRKYESTILSQMDACFPITEPDLELAKQMNPKANLLKSTAGVNVDDWKPNSAVERNPRQLIHATVYKWVHNIDAITWFADKVLPILSDTDKNIKLTLLGKSAPEWLSKYHSAIDLVGYVPEVKPYLNQAGIYIAPLFVGGGIRIKILEAMAMELPVVASPIAAEGINAGESEGLFIANNENEFAIHILNLVNNDNLRLRSGKAARKFIESNHTWRANVKIMYDEYSRLIQNNNK